MSDLLALIAQSDRLKAIAPDLSDFANDLGDIQHLLRMITELLNQNDDLGEESIARVFALWRAAWPLLDQVHCEVRSIMSNLEPK